MVSDEGDATVFSIREAEPYTKNALLAGVPCAELPSIAGRKYLSSAESSVRLADGSILAGTHDTMLAHIKGEKVYSLGQVCSAGGVHSLTLAKDGTVYGVAGHALGVGQIFSFDPEAGVKLLGLVPEAPSACGRNVAIYRPTVISASPSGKFLAIGGDDELTGIAILKL